MTTVGTSQGRSRGDAQYAAVPGADHQYAERQGVGVAASQGRRGINGGQAWWTHLHGAVRSFGSAQQFCPMAASSIFKRVSAPCRRIGWGRSCPVRWGWLVVGVLCFNNISGGWAANHRDPGARRGCLSPPVVFCCFSGCVAGLAE